MTSAEPVGGQGPSVRTPDLETLARRLLDLLGRITGLESTYLTFIDWDHDAQEILYARNAGDMEIPEGLRVPWADTLCRRALEGGPSYTTDVARVYPDSEAAKALGIRTYLTVPVQGPDGDTFGTVCGASVRGVEISEDAALVLDTLADMVALQLASDASGRLLVEQARQLEAANAALERLALTDGLTGTGNRRALERDLSRLCSYGLRRGEPVAAIVLDVDQFKTVNDRHGHGVGDEVLRALAGHLRVAARNEDVIARLGGDEFVILCANTDCAGAMVVAERIRSAVADGPLLTDAGPVVATISVGVASGDGSDPEALLRMADDALYVAKAQGRNLVATSAAMPCSTASVGPA